MPESPDRKDVLSFTPNPAPSRRDTPPSSGGPPIILGLTHATAAEAADQQSNAARSTVEDSRILFEFTVFKARLQGYREGAPYHDALRALREQTLGAVRLAQILRDGKSRSLWSSKPQYYAAVALLLQETLDEEDRTEAGANDSPMPL